MKLGLSVQLGNSDSVALPTPAPTPNGARVLEDVEATPRVLEDGATFRVTE